MQDGEALLRGGGAEFHFGGVAEDRRCQGSAEIGVETGEIALRIEETETGQLPVDAANQLAATLYGFEGFSKAWSLSYLDLHLWGCGGGLLYGDFHRHNDGLNHFYGLDGLLTPDYWGCGLAS